MSTTELVTDLNRSAQRALRGEVTENLVAVTCGLENHTVKLNAYFEGEVSEDDVEHIQAVGTEIIADFPDGYMIEEACFSVAERAPEVLDFWAYKRDQ